MKARTRGRLPQHWETNSQPSDFNSAILTNEFYELVYRDVYEE